MYESSSVVITLFQRFLLKNKQKQITNTYIRVFTTFINLNNLTLREERTPQTLSFVSQIFHILLLAELILLLAEL